MHEDQTGFILGRDITANIRRTLNAIARGRKNAVPSVLVALDIEKAFDTVEVPYMTRLLKKMGFGDTFLWVIQSLYASSTANLLINGLRSKNILLQRGMRQGCPLSPLLFTICIEPLVHRI